MTPVRPSGSTFPVAGCDCSRFAMTSEASASLVVAKRRPGRGSSLRSGPARIQQCKTALCLDGGRVWDAEVSQVQLNIGLYAKSSYRGFLVAPYDSVTAPFPNRLRDGRISPLSKAVSKLMSPRPPLSNKKREKRRI